MARLPKIAKFWLVVLCACYPAVAAAAIAPVAIFPLQDLSRGSNGVDLPFTRYLSNRLEKEGTEICNLDTVIAFMANNRIRYLGKLGSYHVRQVRENLGAAYVLLGTVTQKKVVPTMVIGAQGRLTRKTYVSLGVTLTLIRTYDGTTIWSYAGAFNTADFQKILGIGTITSIEAMQKLLGDEILDSWPRNKLKEEQQSIASIASLEIAPKFLQPGAKVNCQVRLRNAWPKDHEPKGFFKVDEQIYAASYSPGGNSYKASWIVGDKDGDFPVNLVLEWPLYGRIETVQLGEYVVDGVPPLIEIDLKGEDLAGERPMFKDEVHIVPRMLVRKPLARWNFTIKNKEDLPVFGGKGDGNLPEGFVWKGQNAFGDLESEGIFQAVVEVWDEAGNYASASKTFELDSRRPFAEVGAELKGQKVNLELKNKGKVPLAFWQLELWTGEGKRLKTTEGKQLPAQISLELPTGAETPKLEGALTLIDIVGNKSRQNIKDLLQPVEKPKKKAVEEKTATKAWVNEF